MPPHIKFDAAAQKRFIRDLSETGHVGHTCAGINISRYTAYNHRRRNQKFKEAWDVAMDVAIHKLEDEAFRRSHDGIERNVWYKGEVVGKERHYSDTLLMHRLNAERPDKYHYRQSVEHSGNIVTKVCVNFVKSKVEKDEAGG